jgi:hypothetical protein
VFVSASGEGINLPQSGNRKPVLLFFELQLLERDDIPGLSIASTEDNAARAPLDLVQPLIGEHGASGNNRRVERMRCAVYSMMVWGGDWAIASAGKGGEEHSLSETLERLGFENRFGEGWVGMSSSSLSHLERFREGVEDPAGVLSVGTFGLSVVG